MSISKVIYLHCDGAKCPLDGAAFDHAPLSGETAAEQRERARAEGWRRRQSQDLCPNCAAPHDHDNFCYPGADKKQQPICGH